MIITLIIGKNSNLSQHLKKKIVNSVLISSREIQKDINILAPYKKQKINLIFNNFQSSTLLNSKGNSTEYISNAIMTSAMVLDYFRGCSINKIIYTSSSSVYGNNICCREYDEVKPLNLHASLKIANEKLIEKYCEEENINYTITRIFNMYGGNDTFSVISKIIDANRKDKTITIVNQGNAIRDFIHVEDVVEIYKRALEGNVKILNIGSGEGISIKTLIDFLALRDVQLKVKNIARSELKISTADITVLKEITGFASFVRVQDYLKNELC